jgi:hypothetical protein
MPQTHSPAEPVAYEWEAVSADQMRALAKATRSDHVHQMPPTFPTIYRWGEFEWLKRLGVDLRNLLHTDQEYEYLAPLVAGEKPKITTTLKSQRAKAGMTFLNLETVIECAGRPAVRALTTFVVKGVLKEPA